MRKLSFVVLVSVLLSMANCGQLHAQLSSKLNSMNKPTWGHMGNYIHGIQTHAFIFDQSFTRDQIDSYQNQQLQYSLTGEHISTSRSLKGRYRAAPVHRAALVHRPAQVHRPALVYRAASVHRPTLERAAPVHRLAVRWAAPVHAALQQRLATVFRVPLQTVSVAEKVTFTPYKGLATLKFGRKYQNVFTNQIIRNKGNSVGIVESMEGERDGQNIHFVGGYGWSFGAMKPLFREHKYKKCKRFLFWRNCWMATENIERGLFMDEIDMVSKLLHNNAFSQISSKLAASRMLSMSSLARHERLHLKGKVDAVQKLTDVSISQVYPAVESMLGNQYSFSPSHLAHGRSLALVDDFGTRHVIRQKLTHGGKKVTLQVFTSKSK